MDAPVRRVEMNRTPSREKAGRPESALETSFEALQRGGAVEGERGLKGSPFKAALTIYGPYTDPYP